MATRKDYEGVANAIADNSQDADTILALCDYFESDNANFDREKFKQMCGYDPRWDMDMEPDWDAIDRYILGIGPHPWGIVQEIY